MGQLLDQVTTMGQRPTVTLVNVPFSLKTFTDWRSPGRKEIICNDNVNYKL